MTRAPKLPLPLNCPTRPTAHEIEAPQLLVSAPLDFCLATPSAAIPLCGTERERVRFRCHRHKLSEGVWSLSLSARVGADRSAALVPLCAQDDRSCAPPPPPFLAPHPQFTAPPHFSAQLCTSCRLGCSDRCLCVKESGCVASTICLRGGIDRPMTPTPALATRRCGGKSLLHVCSMSVSVQAPANFRWVCYRRRRRRCCCCCCCCC